MFPPKIEISKKFLSTSPFGRQLPLRSEISVGHIVRHNRKPGNASMHQANEQRPSSLSRGCYTKAQHSWACGFQMQWGCLSCTNTPPRAGSEASTCTLNGLSNSRSFSIDSEEITRFNNSKHPNRQYSNPTSNPSSANPSRGSQFLNNPWWTACSSYLIPKT